MTLGFLIISSTSADLDYYIVQTLIFTVVIPIITLVAYYITWANIQNMMTSTRLGRHLDEAFGLEREYDVGPEAHGPIILITLTNRVHIKIKAWVNTIRC